MPYTNLVGDSSFQDRLAHIQAKLGKGEGGRVSSALLRFVWGSVVEPGIVLLSLTPRSVLSGMTCC